MYIPFTSCCFEDFRIALHQLFSFYTGVTLSVTLNIEQSSKKIK